MGQVSFRTVKEFEAFIKRFDFKIPEQHRKQLHDVIKLTARTGERELRFSARRGFYPWPPVDKATGRVIRPDATVRPVRHQNVEKTKALIAEAEAKVAAKKQEDIANMRRVLKTVILVVSVLLVSLALFLTSKFPDLYYHDFSSKLGHVETVDYYAVLGLERTATHQDIRRAFRTLSLERHPDRNPTCVDCTAQFAALVEAHKVLSDPDRRRQYDLHGQDRGDTYWQRSREEHHVRPTRTFKPNEPYKRHTDL
jgi:hypothetical protein